MKKSQEFTVDFSSRWIYSFGQGIWLISKCSLGKIAEWDSVYAKAAY